MRRQILLITHNPNLVVNTDAEQIVVAECVKDENGAPKFTYVSGAIEDFSFERGAENRVPHFGGRRRCLHATGAPLCVEAGSRCDGSDGSNEKLVRFPRDSLGENEVSLGAVFNEVCELITEHEPKWTREWKIALDDALEKLLAGPLDKETLQGWHVQQKATLFLRLEIETGRLQVYVRDPSPKMFRVCVLKIG